MATSEAILQKYLPNYIFPHSHLSAIIDLGHKEWHNSDRLILTLGGIPNLVAIDFSGYSPDKAVWSLYWKSCRYGKFSNLKFLVIHHTPNNSPRHLPLEVIIKNCFANMASLRVIVVTRESGKVDLSNSVDLQIGHIPSKLQLKYNLFEWFRSFLTFNDALLRIKVTPKNPKQSPAYRYQTIIRRKELKDPVLSQPKPVDKPVLSTTRRAKRRKIYDNLFHEVLGNISHT